MDLKLSDDHIKEVLSAAILQMIAPEHRDELLRSALADLIQPKKVHSNAASVSRLQELFNEAAVKIARDVIQSELERDSALRLAIAGAAVEALTQALHKTTLLNDMATLIGKAFSGAADYAVRY